MSKKGNTARPSKAVKERTSHGAVDREWEEIGLASPARQALVDAKLLKVSDLRKVSLEKLKGLHGLGPNAIRILVAETKKRDISFRTSK
jgi:hypothetical protein